MAVALELYSSGESCPSFSGESIIVIRAVGGVTTANLTLTLPRDLDVMSVLPSTRGVTALKDGVFTAPTGTKVGDKFFLLGHYTGNTKTAAKSTDLGVTKGTTTTSTSGSS